jgi:hypothetical protein
MTILAAIFRNFELDVEKQNAATVRENLGKMALLMTKYNMNETEKKLVNVFLPEIPKCGMAGFEDEDWCLWAWDGAFFFAFETMTSIGYGTFTPKTNRSRWFIIFLAPIGIALVGYSCGIIGDIFTLCVHNGVKACATAVNPSLFKGTNGRRRENISKGFCLIVSVICLIFIGGALGQAEHSDWSTFDGVWFSVVTLTTIGYGEYVPTVHGSWVWPTVIWVFAGLGVMASTISFVSDQFEFASKRLSEEVDSFEEHHLHLHEAHAPSRAPGLGLFAAKK